MNRHKKFNIIKVVIKYFDFDFKNFKRTEKIVKNGKILDITNNNGYFKNDKKTSKAKVESKLNIRLNNLMNRDILFQYYNCKYNSLTYFLAHEESMNNDSVFQYTFKRKITKVCIYNSDFIIIGIENGEIYLVNLKSYKIEKSYSDQTSRIINIIALPENHLFFAASNDGLLRIYNINFASSINTLEYIGIYCNLEICNINNKKHLIIGSQNGIIEVYAVAGWKLEYEIQIKNSFVTCTKFVSIFNWLIVGNFEGELVLIQIETKEKMAEYHKVHKGLINFIFLLKDYFFLSASSEDNLIILWNVTSEESMKIWDFTNIMLKNITPKNPIWNQIISLNFECKNDFFEYYSYIFKNYNNIVNCILIDNNYLFIINNINEIYCIDFKNNEIFNKIKEQEMKIKSKNLDNYLPLKEVVELDDSENNEDLCESKLKKFQKPQIKFNDKRELIEYYLNNSGQNYKSYCNFLNRLRLVKVGDISKNLEFKSNSKEFLTNIVYFELIDIDIFLPKGEILKSLKSYCVVNRNNDKEIIIYQ